MASWHASGHLPWRAGMQIRQLRQDLLPAQVNRANMVLQMTTAEVVQKCRAALEGHYGSQFRGLVLYGSVARDQASLVSDIDLLVLLNKPFDYFQELRRIIDLLYPIQLDSDQLISAKPAPLDEFEGGSIQLYRNARREGTLL
jgi:predicted nucleotidyltransferase